MLMASESQQELAGREDGQGGKDAVEAVEQAAVAGEQGAGILDRRMALHQAFEQVPDDGESDGDHAEDDEPEQMGSVPNTEQVATQQHDERAGRDGAVYAGPGLSRADPGRELALAEETAAEISPRIG